MAKQHTSKAQEGPCGSKPPSESIAPGKTLTAASRRDIATLRGVPYFLEGYDSAIIGTTIHTTAPDRPGATLPVYDRKQIIDELMFHGMNEEQAEEAFKKHVAGQWFGALTPIIVTLIDEE